MRYHDPMQTPHFSLPSDFEKKGFYTTQEVADLLNVHVATVRRWIQNNTLFAFRFSARVTRIPYGALAEFVGTPLPVSHETMSQARADSINARIAAEHRGLAAS